MTCAIARRLLYSCPVLVNRTTTAPPSLDFRALVAGLLKAGCVLGRSNGQRHSDSSCGRSSGGRRGCDTTFQDEEESSPLECRKRDVCWRFQEQTNAPLIIPASGQVPGRRGPPQREVCVPALFARGVIKCRSKLVCPRICNKSVRLIAQTQIVRIAAICVKSKSSSGMGSLFRHHARVLKRSDRRLLRPARLPLLRNSRPDSILILAHSHNSFALPISCLEWEYWEILHSRDDTARDGNPVNRTLVWFTSATAQSSIPHW